LINSNINVDFAVIKQAAATQITELVQKWLPGGKQEGNEWIALNPTRSDQSLGSFKINLSSGAWSDFACDDSGKDVTSLYCYLNGGEYRDNMIALGRELGIGINESTKKSTIYPEAPSIWYFKEIKTRLKPSLTWDYLDKDKNEVARVLRFDHKDFKKGKEYRQIRKVSGGWEKKAPEYPRSLYNLPAILENPDKPLIFCEGEKAANAGIKLFPTSICTTTIGGSQAPQKTDFSPSKDRQVYIWPDNDAPGKAYAQKIIKLAIKAGAKAISILQIPRDWQEKWDAADILEQGITPPKFSDWAKVDPVDPSVVPFDPSVDPFDPSDQQKNAIDPFQKQDHSELNHTYNDGCTVDPVDPIDPSFGTFDPSFGTFDPSFGTQKSSFGTLPKMDHTELNQDDSSVWHVWHAPIPLIEKNEGLIEVTNDMLPQNVGNWITDIANRMQIYPTFPSVALISIASAIIARRIAIHPKQFDVEWRVIPNIWGGVVGQPGVQKSPALAPMFAPVRKRESLLKKEYENALKKYQHDLEKWQELPKNKRAEKPTEPAKRTLFINDGTMEAIHVAHKHNPQGILLYRDELSGFIDAMAKHGREGERQFYLEGWLGDGSYSMTRIGRQDVDVDGLCLTVFGGIQPSVLSNYISNAASGKADDGFIQRFQLLVSSVPKPDYRLTDTVPDWDAKKLFESTMDRLLDLPIHGTPAITTFASDAQPIFNEWLENLERRIRAGNLPAMLASHISKYRSLLPSLALIFEVLANPDFCVQNITRQEILPKISAVNLKLSIKWVEFLENHARNLLLDSPGENSPSALLAEKILQKFRNGKWQDGATERSLKRMFKAKTDNQHFDDALELLEDFGVPCTI